MNRIYLFNKVPFDQVDKKTVISLVARWVRENKKKKVLNMNAYGVVTYLENKEYQSEIDSADLIYPDGWGPVLASKFQKNSLTERINVGDFIDDLFLKLNKSKSKIFLLGCESKTVRKTVKKISIKYPAIEIVGYHSGFFNSQREKALSLFIRKLDPDLVLVGMGIPFQENWMKRNWDLLPDSVYMGVGGVFYYISNLKQRAPIWVGNLGFEWLYRFFQEPKRLFKRYTLKNIQFLLFFWKNISIRMLKK